MSTTEKLMAILSNFEKISGVDGIKNFGDFVPKDSQTTLIVRVV